MTLLSLLLSFTVSEYVEITDLNVHRYIGGHKPAVVKFYKEMCGQCIDIAPEFSNVSTLYSDVVFGGVDCDTYEHICRQHEIDDIPVILLFPPGSQRGLPFNEEFMRSDEISKFILKATGKRPYAPLVSNVQELNALNIQKFTSRTQCGMVLFTGRKCHFCDHLEPQFMHLSGVYHRETNISIGIIRCEDDVRFCESMDVYDGGSGSYGPNQDDFSPAATNLPIYPPAIKWFKNGKWHNFTATQIMSEMVTLLNAECGAERRPDGLLSDAAGTSRAGDEVVKQFLRAKDDETRKQLVEQVRKIAGGDVYAMAMERYIEKGAEQMKKDTQTMKLSLDERKSSIAARDTLKRRYNVFLRLVSPATLRTGGAAAAKDGGENL
jgi:thiol-disulfide isomerase/thioredoxin